MPTQTKREQRSPARSPLAVAFTSRDDRLRVLHVVSRIGMGGTEQGVLKVIRGLGKEEFDHRVCAVRGIDHDFKNRMKMEEEVYAAGSPEPGFQFPLFRLVSAMREFSPHIVHTRNFGALEAIAAARISGVPVAIHSEHGYELEILSGLPLRRRFLCRTLYPLADTVFTVTSNLRDYHSQQSWLPKERFRVIHNGVNTESYAPHRELAPSVRSRLGIPVGRIVIGNVGRLVPIKDQATLFRAAEILIDIGKDVHLLIVGSGPELAKLRARVEGSCLLARRVTFELESDRIPELMNAMDIFALTSICEGMSNTILEAMATGLPVVATRAGGNPELVEHGRTGWLFSPRDAEALAQRLIRLVDDSELRRHFGQESRRTAVDRFSLFDMLRGYRDLYVDLAARRGVWKGN